MYKAMKHSMLTMLVVSTVISCGGGGSASPTNPSPPTPPAPSPPPAPSSPEVSFSSMSDSIIVRNTDFNVSWQSSNASTCEASGDWSGSKSLSGTETLTENEVGEKNYTLECTGDGGEATDSVQVTIVDLPELTFGASVLEVPMNTEFELSWSSQATTACEASGDWAGSKETSGTENLVESSEGIKIYVLTCEGLGGSVTETATVTVLSPPSITMESSVDTVPADMAFDISWSVTNATSCQANGNWAGEKSLAASETIVETDIGLSTYSLDCIGPGGESSESISVDISNPLTVTVTPSVAKAPAGVDFFISWSSTDADSCSAAGDWAGEKATEGEQYLNLDVIGEQTYTLTCEGERGTVESTATVDIFDYTVDEYHGTRVPDYVADAPDNVEYFESTTEVAGQLEGVGHQETAEFGAGKFVFNRVYRAMKHGLSNGQQFGIFGSWVHSYENNSIEGGLWVNPKTTGPQYYPSLHLAGIGDTYYACNDVVMGGGLYEKVIADRWLTQFQISNQVLSVPGMNIGFDMHQPSFEQDNGIWVGSGWSYLNLDHPREFKYWMSFVETYDYQGPINGYIPEHFNWIDPEKVEEGSYAERKAAAGDRFGTFATLGSRPNGGNGNERVHLSALDLGDGNYYVPIDHMPNEKTREYLVAFPQSIEQSTMEDYSRALKQDALTNTLISADFKNFNSVYKSTHNQLKLIQEVAGEQHMHMVVPAYDIGYSNKFGFVDWDFTDQADKIKRQTENGYIYVRKTTEKWDVEQYASEGYRNHPHLYKTELIDAPDSVVRAPKSELKFFNYKERDTSNPEFANWDTTGMKRHQVLLQNGAIATYVWFKFIEQPAIKTAQQNHPEVYTDEYLETLQGYIEKLHTRVALASKTKPDAPVFINYENIEEGESSQFNLAKIDPAQLVKPEDGQAVGYVPVVISVYHPEAFSSNGMGLVTEPDPICTNDEWTDTYYPDI